MFEVDDRQDSRKVNNCYIVGYKSQEIDLQTAEEHLSELGELVTTMGLEILGQEVVNLRSPSSAYYIGSGKAEEIIETAKSIEAECIVLDFDISPAQQKNWEKKSGLCVIDRQEVILDIFAERAITKEAVIQVALARMEYSLPRLTRAWTHLSRQRGGNKGTRGEGETQLEVDKRLVQQRISYLKKELQEVQKHREVQRQKRENSTTPSIAIVGYTNVGKSSLLNHLSNADVLVEDKLFATLDPTTRMVQLKDKQKVLFSDTVGFVRKLPHNLVEAFKSTLESALISDVILHVLDASSQSVDEHHKTTIELLKELDAHDKPIITVYNKIDKVSDDMRKAILKAERSNAIFISVKEGQGIDDLQNKIIEQISKDTSRVELSIPLTKYDDITKVYSIGKVLNIEYSDENALITAKISGNNISSIKEYLI